MWKKKSSPLSPPSAAAAILMMTVTAAVTVGLSSSTPSSSPPLNSSVLLNIEEASSSSSSPENESHAIKSSMETRQDYVDIMDVQHVSHDANLTSRAESIEMSSEEQKKRLWSPHSAVSGYSTEEKSPPPLISSSDPRGNYKLSSLLEDEKDSTKRSTNSSLVRIYECIRESSSSSLCSPHLFNITNNNSQPKHEPLIQSDRSSQGGMDPTDGYNVTSNRESTVYFDLISSPLDPSTTSTSPIIFGTTSHEETSTSSLSLNSSMFDLIDSKNSTIIVEPDLSIHHPILALVLGLMCVTVIFGNILVMVAIKRERYLKTVTNYFVASLAAADCLVGLIVMPFSVVHEVMNKWWVFGQDWCDLWHSFDVLASTASILNLCVISLDRYWAITDPLSYPSRMTSKRAKGFIAIVWTCSALISFPAIIWWRSVSPPNPDTYECLFTDDIGYLVFSSIISFYGPLTVMIFVYYRIYRAAVNHENSIAMGSKNVTGLGDGGENPVVLRIHRGGFCAAANLTSSAAAVVTATASAAIASASLPGLTEQPPPQQNNNNNHHKKRRRGRKWFGQQPKGSSSVTSSSQNDQHQADDGDHPATSHKLETSPASSSHSSHPHHHNLHNNLKKVTSTSSTGNDCGHERTRNSSTSSHQRASNRAEAELKDAVRARNLKAWSMGRKFSKFAKEKKAAKTLGIVMGVFVICWLPFFVTNILMGVCPDSCITDPELVGSIVTWLGWINSGMNPIIYACWSRDFRRAFKKILCGCCTRSQSRRERALTHARYSNHLRQEQNRCLDRNNSSALRQPLNSASSPISDPDDSRERRTKRSVPTFRDPVVSVTHSSHLNPVSSSSR